MPEDHGDQLEFELPLPAENPLKKKWRRLIRFAPKAPGIYLMLDRRGQLLYVGKARCLRDRLNSYRFLRYEEVAGTTQRLMQSAQSLQWVELSSESEAILAENELLRTLRPPLNQLGVDSHTKLYFGFAKASEGWVLDLRSPARPSALELEWNKIGVFAGPQRLVRVFSALCRHGWLASQGQDNWPSYFSKPIFKAPQKIPGNITDIERFLLGLDMLPDLTLQDLKLSQPDWIQSLLVQDSMVLSSFFVRDALRLREYRETQGLSETLILASRLDDEKTLRAMRKRQSQE